MTAKFDSRLPAGDGDGLAPITGRLLSQPDTMHVVIGICDCRKTVTDHDRHEAVPVVRIRRIEVIRRADDLPVAEKLMRRALEARSGQTVLPLDIEDELSQAFAAVEDEDEDASGGNGGGGEG